jgi:hypothetical protein
VASRKHDPVIDMGDAAISRYCATCPTCGALVPKDDIALSLVGKQRRIFETIRRAGTAGIGADDIRRVVYVDDPDGGPSSPSVIAVTIRVINVKIQRFGLIIRGGRGRNGVYRLYRIEGAS